MFVLSWQHRNLKCSDTRIRLTRAWEAHFYRSEGGEKKSSRIVWLLHNAMPTLLEMLSQNGNEKKARSTAYILPKGFYTNMNSGKYHSHWLQSSYFDSISSRKTGAFSALWKQSPKSQYHLHSLINDLRVLCLQPTESIQIINKQIRTSLKPSK